MITYPITQKYHNYIDSNILPWIDLHFPADSSYNGRVFLGVRKIAKDRDYFETLSRRNIGELRSFIPEMHISQVRDYYITANAMSGVERANNHVFSLHNIVIDVDLHEEGVSHYEEAMAFIWRCKRDLWSTGNCPAPNSVVFTGRGVQLWWAIDPISVKVLYYYRRVQSWLMDQLEAMIEEYPEDLGFHKIDRLASIKIAGWFRLPLTYNTKTNRRGTLEIINKKRYKLQELLDKYVPKSYRPRLSVVSNGTYKGHRPHFDFAPLADKDADLVRGCNTALSRRALQLAKLRAIRNAKVDSEQRDLFNFSVFCSLVDELGSEEALERTSEFNSGFKNPMTERKLKQVLSTAMVKQYHLTNSWVIETLDISEAEQEEIGLYPSGNRYRKLKPNHTRDTARSILKSDRDNKIITLFENGYNKSRIAQMLKIARNTVIRVIKAFFGADVSTAVEKPAAASQKPIQTVATTRAAQKSVQKKVRKNSSNKYVSYRQDPGVGGDKKVIPYPATTIRNIGTDSFLKSPDDS